MKCPHCGKEIPDEDKGGPPPFPGKRMSWEEVGTTKEGEEGVSCKGVKGKEAAEQEEGGKRDAKMRISTEKLRGDKADSRRAGVFFF
jgi:hypothetical protein